MEEKIALLNTLFHAINNDPLLAYGAIITVDRMVITGHYVSPIFTELPKTANNEYKIFAKWGTLMAIGMFVKH